MKLGQSCQLYDWFFTLNQRWPNVGENTEDRRL